MSAGPDLGPRLPRKAARLAPTPAWLAKRPKPRAPVQGEIARAIAGETGLPVRDVLAVLAALRGVVARHLSEGDRFIIPGLVTFQRYRRPPARAHMTKSAYSGRMIEVPAQPARNAIKAKPLKAVRDLA